MSGEFLASLIELCKQHHASIHATNDKSGRQIVVVCVGPDPATSEVFHLKWINAEGIKGIHEG